MSGQLPGFVKSDGILSLWDLHSDRILFDPVHGQLLYRGPARAEWLKLTFARLCGLVVDASGKDKITLDCNQDPRLKEFFPSAQGNEILSVAGVPIAQMITCLDTATLDSAKVLARLVRNAEVGPSFQIKDENGLVMTLKLSPMNRIRCIAGWEVSK